MFLNQSYRSSTLLLSLAIPLLVLSGCGGSGGALDGSVNNPTSGNNTTGTTVSDTTWVQGSFKPSTTFAARCENPRTGSSPITNEVYPDRTGSELLEKFWQRSFTHETYLWYRDVIDQDPNNFSLVEYFDQLKSFDNL